MRENFWDISGNNGRNQSQTNEHFLQSAVAMFISDYTMDFWQHDGVTLLQACSSVDIGVETLKGITWGVSYLSLAANEKQRLRFYIRASVFVDHSYRNTEVFSEVFMCTVWTAVGILRFSLAGKEGKLIRNFQLEEGMAHGVFQPVVLEIKKQMQRSRKRSGSNH